MRILKYSPKDQLLKGGGAIAQNCSQNPNGGPSPNSPNSKFATEGSDSVTHFQGVTESLQGVIESLPSVAKAHLGSGCIRTTYWRTSYHHRYSSFNFCVPLGYNSSWFIIIVTKNVIHKGPHPHYVRTRVVLDGFQLSNKIWELVSLY